MIDIIPAIDIINGQCVRLSQGDFARKKVYEGSPLDIALGYEAIGIRRLHIVDLDGARSGAPANLHILGSIARNTSLVIDYGGGIRTIENADEVLMKGATMINVSSILIKQPQVVDEWIREYGAEKIFVGADVHDGKIAISGWQEKTTTDIYSFIKNCVEKHLLQIFCTDIQYDGMLNGPSVALYKEIISRAPSVRLVASGGISSMEDLYALEDAGCAGAIIGKAIYEGSITLKELENYIGNGTR